MNIRLREAVVAALLAYLLVGWGASSASATPEVVASNVVALELSQPIVVPGSAAELGELLSGKWRQVSWRPRLNPGEYRAYSEQHAVYKYYSHGKFVFYNYDAGGRLYLAYGGVYEVLSKDRIRETIEFFGPYGRTSAGPESGQLVLHTGATMVGAVAEFRARVADGQLFLTGDQKQNTESVKHPDRYQDRFYDNGHIKLHD